MNTRLKDLVNLVHEHGKLSFSIVGNEYAVCLLKWSANECGKELQHACFVTSYVRVYCILYDYTLYVDYTSSTAQGGGGSFKNRTL